MKIGILSDIHGNHYALAEVLRIARKEKIQKLLILGDLVGYYYHPEKALEMLKEWDMVFIKGNHEKILEQLLLKSKQGSDVQKKYGSGHSFALKNLSTDQLQVLITAPDQQKITFDNVKLLMCHGSPWDPDLYLYPDSEGEILDKCNVKDVDFVLTGHSHYPFVYRNQNSVLINVGSVGQSRNMGGLASWVLINTTNKCFELKATPYNITPLLKEIEIIDPEITYLKDILTRNNF